MFNLINLTRKFVITTNYPDTIERTFRKGITMILGLIGLPEKTRWGPTVKMRKYFARNNFPKC